MTTLEDGFSPDGFVRSDGGSVEVSREDAFVAREGSLSKLRAVAVAGAEGDAEVEAAADVETETEAVGGGGAGSAADCAAEVVIEGVA